VLQNTPQEQLRLPGLELSLWDSGYSAAKFDVMLSLAPVNGGLTGYFEYAAELFAPERMERMARHFTGLLEAIADGTVRRLSEISLLGEDERQKILVEWNQTSRGYPQVKGLHALVAAQAEKTPEAVALVCGIQKLTYRELNQRANQLAHYLRRAGVGPETLVGVCMTRSQAMVVALLAVLKSGSAYVPLDPAYPPERLRFMFHDTGLKVVLTQRELLARIPQGQARILCMEDEQARIEQESG
jgi:non-ribosomal peptide synthetase component F